MGQHVAQCHFVFYQDFEISLDLRFLPFKFIPLFLKFFFDIQGSQYLQPFAVTFQHFRFLDYFDLVCHLNQ